MRKIVYGLLGFNLVLFLAGIALFGFALVSYHPWAVAQTTAPTASAAQPATTSSVQPAKTTSTGAGLALLGAALATAGSSLGAGWALSNVGAAAIGAVTEKPSMFGISLVYVGLAEGIAIYGIVISIMIIGKI